MRFQFFVTVINQLCLVYGGPGVIVPIEQKRVTFTEKKFTIPIKKVHFQIPNLSYRHMPITFTTVCLSVCPARVFVQFLTHFPWSKFGSIFTSLKSLLQGAYHRQKFYFCNTNLKDASETELCTLKRKRVFSSFMNMKKRILVISFCILSVQFFDPLPMV